VIPASVAAQRPPDMKLLVIDERGAITHRARADVVTLVRADDVVVANDAATLPASLAGVHRPTGGAVEVRLAGRDSLRPSDVARFTAVVFGAGDFRTPTEHRPPPPALHPGDELQLGPLRAIVLSVLGHPRLIEMRFENPVGDIWEGLARHGRPIQYAYVPDRLAIWDTWTQIASQPVAFEAPSAGFILDWAAIGSLRARGAAFATLTHAAGISSTGDAELDRLLPLDEPYYIPASTARLIEACRDRGGRVIAVGTTVVRALEHAARADGSVRPGAGTATERIGPATPLRCVDAIVSGTHEPGTSHYDLLRAFQDGEVLRRMEQEANAFGYRTHEFGDSVFLARSRMMSNWDSRPRAEQEARRRVRFEMPVANRFDFLLGRATTDEPVCERGAAQPRNEPVRHVPAPGSYTAG
jgi:S-adenosylmethionine:tRNA ribosyltransferase-isomerase